ncbi:MAG: peptidylprolyl isomerase [Deltaproteobacteria bacterium]|nr:peptidylprolyl isomerase [Deltaproteobacteria bacterium]
MPEPVTPAADTPHRATLHTERGEIVIELLVDASPTTTQRFTQLVGEGFFDGLTFHRVVAGFVAQGGDPRGDGYGGPPWWQRCEDSPLGYHAGTVGMALAGRDTGGSQFFITTGAQHHLDGRYTVFGRVVDGLEHVEALQVGDPILRVTLDP